MGGEARGAGVGVGGGEIVRQTQNKQNKPLSLSHRSAHDPAGYWSVRASPDLCSRW